MLIRSTSLNDKIGGLMRFFVHARADIFNLRTVEQGIVTYSDIQ